MTTILMDYNLALMSSAQLFIRIEVHERVHARVWVADVLGRRGTLVGANVFLMAGALAMSLGDCYAALMAARFVSGVGFSVVVAPIFVNAGILLISYVSNYAFAGLPVRIGWRVMYAAGVLPPVFLAAGVLAMPESPRWLVMCGRHGEARTVLVRTSDDVAEADLGLEEIKQATEAPAPRAGPGGGGVWTELLVRPLASVRRILALYGSATSFKKFHL
ncbi:hypothetical protein SETIT_8G204800v2 [Setaria italica]|uniref:Major facilitator superfamily (MFS) profile domain-containing protein n=1 Tax=Setaria italica TaxID=4555 RepID=K3ZP06_SETIT|nr:hypothetical protein SETIT_8G204800v2 [Setaria italica]